MPRDRASRFALGVIVVAVFVLLAELATGRLTDFEPTATVVMLGVLVIVGEFIPIRMPMQDNDLRISASTMFTFALLVVGGPGPALLAFAAASLLVDLAANRVLLKLAFNLSQAVITAAVAGWALTGLSALPGEALRVQDAIGLAVSAFALFFVNNALTHLVTSFALGRSPREGVRDARTSMAADALLLAFAPVVIVVAAAGWALLPLLLVPLAILIHSSREADRRRHDALHDPLTDLPNRVLFRRLLDGALAGVRRRGGSFALLVIDLDRFKEINDALGHGQGDVVLRTIAARMPSIAAQETSVARLSGDEFGILALGATDETEARALADRLRQALEEPVEVGGLRVAAGGSIGIAISQGADDATEAMLRRADVAMYLAKERGSGIEVYTPDADPHTPERLALAAELRDAIPRGELVLHFQPKVTVARGEVDGVEALVRWQHPERGLLPPGAFLHFAEQSDLMRPLTMDVLDKALDQVAQWRADGIDLHVAVNLSAQTLLDRTLPDEVARLLAKHRVAACALQLELTESTLMRDPARSAEVLEELAATGVRIAIDDFGTGWSSLMWLKKLPVTSIKIDRSFVGDMLTSSSDAAIVRSTVSLGRSLGLDVVAEGVETPETLEQLADCGCDVVQGYLISRPEPAEVLTPWLLERSRPALAA